MHSKKQVAAGDRFEVPYPFVRGLGSEWDGERWATKPCWNPGTQQVPKDDDVDTQANGMGHQVITVVDTFRPGRFPVRVFYTRQWRDPDGREFGKGGLHVLSLAKFTALLRGYRHDFTVVDVPIPELPDDEVGA